MGQPQRAKHAAPAHNAWFRVPFLPESWLADEFVSPTQLLPSRHLSPEQTLVLAVLLDGVYRWQRARLDSPIRRQEEAWLRDDDHDRPFSFAHCCDVLGLDAGQCRAHVFGVMAAAPHSIRLVNRGMRMALNRRRVQQVTPGYAWDARGAREGE